MRLPAVGYFLVLQRLATPRRAVFLHLSINISLQIVPMNKLYTLLLCSCLLGSAHLLNAQTSIDLYAADFSIEGQGVPDHTSLVPPAPGPQTFEGGTPPNNWTVGYDVTPLSDNSDNEFSVNNGVIRIQDFGGEGFLNSRSIDVTGLSTVSITGLGEVLGSGVQNSPQEFFQWFYVLDGNTPINAPRNVDNAGDELGVLWQDIDVSGAETLTVGFRFRVNGGGDGYLISALNVSGTEAPLAVTLATWEVEAAGTSAAHLRWTTATESNHDYFGLEVSTDGEHYTEFDRVYGHGDTDEGHSYRAAYSLSAEQSSGTRYFRLRSVDRDGLAEYSPLRALDMGTAAEAWQIMGSNLVQDELLLELPANAAPFTLRILTTAGNVLSEHRVEIDSPASVPVSFLPPGMYILTDGERSRRFVRR